MIEFACRLWKIHFEVLRVTLKVLGRTEEVQLRSVEDGAR
jgi:hypothetical protein